MFQDLKPEQKTENTVFLIGKESENVEENQLSISGDNLKDGLWTR